MWSASGLKANRKQILPVLLLTAAAAMLIIVLLLLPLIYGMMYCIAVVLVAISVSMFRSRYLSRISFRNLMRKKRTTILLVLGLSAGMVMITSSLVISDTIDGIIVSQVENRMAGTDLVIKSYGGSNGYHEMASMNGLLSSISNVSGVGDVNGVLIDTVSVVDRDNGQFTPAVKLLGFNDSVIPRQLRMTSVNGLEIIRAPQMGCAYISYELSQNLGARTGDLLLLIKGDSKATFRLTSIVTYSGMERDQGGTVLLGMGDCGFISGMKEGVNSLLISYVNDRPGMTTSDSAPITSMVTGTVRSFDPAGDWQTVREKSLEVQGQRQYFGTFLDLYFIFDAIFLAAGAVLISNILIMFAHERNEEMKALRAMGMKRHDIIRMFVFEGTAYAALSSLMGVAFGCLAVVLAVQFEGSSIRIDGEGIDRFLIFSPQSLIFAFLLGLAIMLVIIYAVCWIAIGANRARDQGRAVAEYGGRDMLVRVGRISLTYGIGSLFIGTMLHFTWLQLAGATCISISLGPLLCKYLTGIRSWVLASVALILVWVPKPSGLGLPSLESPEDLILSGVILLAACLMVTILLFDRIALFLMTRSFRKGKLGVISKVVFSNSARVRVRTGLGIAIFGLVVFTITITTMVVGMVDHNVPLIAEQATGGMDIMASTDEPIQINDLWARINGSGILHQSNITAITGLYAISLSVYINGGGYKGSEAVGIDSDFGNHFILPLSDFDAERYDDATEVWSAISTDSSLAIIDGSLEEEIVHNSGIGALSSAIGQNISIMNHGGVQSNLTIIGVSKFNGLSSIFTKQSLLVEEFGMTGPNLFMIKVADGLDPQQQSVLLEKVLIAYGTYAMVIRSSVDRSLADINGSLEIFQVQLFVGLGAGISGLIILTTRSINERKAESGILRSLGFTRRMMAVNYCIETGLSALTGVLIGVTMGIFVGYNIWQAALKGMGFQFYIPWFEITLTGVGILIVMNVALYVLVIRMSSCPPAENLRYE